MYCVPPPISKKEPDLIVTLSVPPASFIFSPGVFIGSAAKRWGLENPKDVWVPQDEVSPVGGKKTKKFDPDYYLKTKYLEEFSDECLKEVDSCLEGWQNLVNAPVSKTGGL